MKTIVTTALLFLAVAGFSQTATRPAATTTGSTTTLSPKEQQLCREWTISKTETFNAQHDPTTEQKGDRLVVMDKGRYRLIMNGVAEGGTWTLDKTGQLLTLTTDAGAVKKFKVLEMSSVALKIDYKDADDIHNIIYYTAAPSTQTR